MIINTPQTCITVIRNLRLKHGILVGGVDEAGRGSIIGPLVVAGISVRESKLAELRRMGVKDSKTLTPRARAKLFGQIINLVDAVCIRKVEPAHPAMLDFYVDFEFRSRLMQQIATAVFNEAVKRMVHAFEKRAHQVYGEAVLKDHTADVKL